MSKPLHLAYQDSGNQPIQVDSETSIRTKQNEIECILEDIRQIDSAMHQLLQRRTAQQRRLNELRSPISILPPEILSTIFQFVCPPSEYNTAHQPVHSPYGGTCMNPIFIICAVSSLWRHTATSTPQLWGKLELDSTRRGFRMVDWANLVHVYAVRSAGCLLDLKLVTGRNLVSQNWETCAHPNHPNIILNRLQHAILVQNSHKIRRLSFSASSVKLFPLFNPSSFPRLRELHLADALRVEEYDHVLDLSHIPHLHSVSLDYPRYIPLLPWTQITTINITGAPIKICLELLLQCPNLIEYCNRHPIFPAAKETQESVAYRPVTLEHIKFLQWTCNNTYWDLALLQNLRPSSLQRLRWAFKGRMQPHINEVLLNFLNFLSPSLEDFGISFGSLRGSPPIQEDTISFLRTIFTTISQIRRLYISGGNWTTTVETAFCSLKSVVDGSIPLPALEKLTLERFSRRSGMDEAPAANLSDGDLDRVALVLEFLRQRRNDLQIPSFDLGLSHPIGWDLETKDEIKRLVRGGLKLQIYECSSYVDWLYAVG